MLQIVIARSEAAKQSSAAFEKLPKCGQIPPTRHSQKIHPQANAREKPALAFVRSL
jgi:hypothetical protein